MARLRSRYDLPGEFVLQVATIEPRKDGTLLAEVCRDLGIPLVLAGGLDPRCRVPRGALHLGRVPDDDRDLLMDMARIVAYISRYEGFGLPPIEAMVRGRPVVATAVGALPDLVGDGAILIDPGDRTALSGAIRSLWHSRDHREGLGRAGRRAIGQLGWDVTAARTLEVYRRISSGA